MGRSWRLGHLVIGVGEFSGDGDEAAGRESFSRLGFVPERAREIARALAAARLEVDEGAVVLHAPRRKIRDAVERAVTQGPAVVHLIGHGGGGGRRLPHVPACP